MERLKLLVSADPLTNITLEEVFATGSMLIYRNHILFYSKNSEHYTETATELFAVHLQSIEFLYGKKKFDKENVQKKINFIKSAFQEMQAIREKYSESPIDPQVKKEFIDNYLTVDRVFDRLHLTASSDLLHVFFDSNSNANSIDKELIWGAFAWVYYHSLAIILPKGFRALARSNEFFDLALSMSLILSQIDRYLPCGICAHHAKANRLGQFLDTSLLQLTSNLYNSQKYSLPVDESHDDLLSDAFFQCHNLVNTSLNKPLLSMEKYLNYVKPKLNQLLSPIINFK